MTNLLFQSGEKVLFIGDSITDCGRRDEHAPFGYGYVNKVIELTTHQNEHHHHIFCSQCGAITDFEIDDRLERDLEKEIRKVELQYSVSVTSHSLALQSLCLKCSRSIVVAST